MRIGSLTSVNIEQWTPTYQRTTVQKQVPGFIVVQTYDVVARNNTLSVKGYLTGTSQSDLATQAMTLRGYANQKKIIWIDASDQYQGYCELVRFLELDGPNLDSSKGILTADFTLKCAMLLPWGTTFTNPFNQSGIVLRDLNGQGLEYMLNPLEMNCNFAISNPNTSSESFSWEFILDNQNAFTNATSQQLVSATALGSGTASTTNPVAVNGASLPSIGVNSFDSISIDAGTYAEALAGSLKGAKSGPNPSAYYGMGYNLGTIGWNLSSYDRLRIWFRCDQSGQSQYSFGLIDTSGNWRQWNISLQAASTWMNIEASFAAYSSHSGTLNLSAIQYVYAFVQTATSAPASVNIWLDDVRAEIGYVDHCFDTSGCTNTSTVVGGNNGGGMTNDTTIYKTSPQLSSYTIENYNASLKITAGSNSNAGVRLNLPVPLWTFTSYYFLVLWYRNDFGGAATGTGEIALITDNTDYYVWLFPNLIANEWYRLVVPLRNPTSTTGSPGLNNVTAIEIGVQSYTGTTVGHLWLDEIAVDVGNWVYLETMMPDSVTQNINPTSNAIQIFAWNPNTSSYASPAGIQTDPYGSVISDPNTWYFLDGELENGPYFGIQRKVSYPVSTINTTTSQNQNVYGSPAAEYITYQALWGTNNRFGFGILMPPATSDSRTGNLPSNDLSGPMALNKVRLRIQVYVSNEDTTYVGN